MLNHEKYESYQIWVTADPTSFIDFLHASENRMRSMWISIAGWKITILTLYWHIRLAGTIWMRRISKETSQAPSIDLSG